MIQLNFSLSILICMMSMTEKGLKSFLEKWAVVRGYVGQLYGALGEAAFFTGVEKNQDIVTLASYAPLLENVNYNAWFPNLIRFNQTGQLWNTQLLHMGSFLVIYRGEHVVEDGRGIYKAVPTGQRNGLPCLVSQEYNTENPLWNGETAVISHELMGKVEETAGIFVVSEPEEEQRTGL